MSEMAIIKRFILRALLAAAGEPMPEAAIDQAVKDSLVPRPLQSDIDTAFKELEEQCFISGQRDDLDQKLVTWTLTGKGQHRAKQLS